MVVNAKISAWTWVFGAALASAGAYKWLQNGTKGGYDRMGDWELVAAGVVTGMLVKVLGRHRLSSAVCYLALLLVTAVLSGIFFVRFADNHTFAPDGAMYLLCLTSLSMFLAGFMTESLDDEEVGKKKEKDNANDKEKGAQKADKKKD